MKVSLDTNILINEPTVVFDNSREFIISFTVIRELDKLKRNPDLKRAAQMAIRNIWVQYLNDKIEIINIPYILGDSPDEQIVQDTKDANASLLSDDIGARIIAKAHGVDISNFEVESDIDIDYKGYITIQGNANYEKHYVPIKEMLLEEFNEVFSVDMKHNMYCIIQRGVVIDSVWQPLGRSDIWKRCGNQVSRISQSTSPLKEAGIIDTPMDAEQQCAIDAIMDPNIPLVVIDGVLGTGKTLVALMAALATSIGQKRYMYYDRIKVTKPPVSINRALYTGFKPGTSEEKLSGHLSGFKSNLKFLLDKDTRRTLKPGETQESKADKVWMELFEVVEIDEVQGASIHNNILLVDEWQLLDTESTKLVASRISQGAKIVLIGDTQGQTYGMNRANEGFKVLFKYLGKREEMAFIKLENIYRSALAKFVAEVFD